MLKVKPNLKTWLFRLLSMTQYLFGYFLIILHIMMMMLGQVVSVHLPNCKYLVNTEATSMDISRISFPSL